MNKSESKLYSNHGNPVITNEVLNAKLQAAMILDLGCGNGDVSKELKKYNHTIHGITISLDEKNAADKIIDTTYLFNLENGLPKEVLENKYDLILCSHVLEHICYPSNLLNDIKKVMKFNSKIIVCLPNLLHYKSRIELLKGNFNYKDIGIWDYTHFRWYTFKTAEELFLKSGFEVEKKYVTGVLPFNSYLTFIPQRFKQFIFKFLSKISEGFFGDQLVYVVTLKNNQ